MSSSAEGGASPDADDDASASASENGDGSNLSGLSAGGDSTLLQRLAVLRYAGMAYNGARDYYETLGYDRKPRPADYRAKWERGGVAETIVNAPAEAAWREAPDIVDDANEGVPEEPETEFEQAVQTLFEDHQLLHYLERWDKAIGLGEYGLLLVGLAESDEPNPDQFGDGAPSLADAAQEDAYEMADLAYFSIFTQQSVSDIDTVTNPMHERFGFPVRYDLELTAGDVSRTATTHYTRVLHAAEGLLDSEVFGKPRLRAVYNRLDDREKILGGSAEAYWRSADRRFHLDYEGDSKPDDADEVADEAEEMIHGLRSVLTTRNTDLNALQGSDPDPSGAIDVNTSEVAGTVGIPKRILTGSERGELASTQDRATFYGRIQERRQQFCEPMMLRPLIDRLRTLGILPEPAGGGYSIEWGQLFELNDLEQAELAAQQAKAIKDASSMDDPAWLATKEEIRTQVFDWDPERGSEAPTPQSVEEEDNEGDITDEEPGDVDEMEDVLEDLNRPVPHGPPGE